ncbi:MAG: DUF1559 domain-containing protein [Planctomycetaceae bacterium]|nr:DUF1559 domain-containing protein [Planctomycetaceae bacterium]
MKILKWTTLSLLLSGIAFVGWSYAQRNAPVAKPETLLPKDSVLYYSVDGGLEHQDAFEKTAAYEALYESGLMEVLTDALTELSKQAPQSDIALDSAKFLQHHGFSVAVTVDPPTNGPPAPWGVIVLHNAAQKKELLDKLSKNAPRQFEIESEEYRNREITHGMIPDTPAQIAWWAEQGHLVVAVGINAVDSALDVADGERENITAHPYWEHEGEHGYEVTQVGWFHFDTLHQMFGGLPVPAPGATPDEPVRINDVLLALGLENFRGVMVRNGYDGKALRSEQFIDAPSDRHPARNGVRRGLLALADQQPMTFDDLPVIPPTQNSLTAVSFNWSDGYDTIMQIVRDVAQITNPRAAEEIESNIAEAERELGIEFKKDLFDSMGHVNCVYTDGMNGSFGLGSAAAISVENPAALRRTIRTVLRRTEQETRGKIQVREFDKHGREIVMISITEFPIVSPTISVDDDWMVIGLNSQAVEAFLLRQDGKLPAWEPDAATAQALAASPQEFTSLSIVDPRGSYGLLLNAAPTIVGLAELGLRKSGSMPRDFKFPIDVTDLPPAELVTGPLFPNVTVGSVSEEGFLVTSRSSLPGAPLVGGIGGGSGVATSGVLVALLLPAVQQAREAARRSQSQNNLKQLALGAHNFHDVYNHFPAADFLPEDKPNEELDEEERLSWLVGLLPYIDQAPIYNQMDLKGGWESDENAFFGQIDIPVLTNPSVPLEPLRNGYMPTHYVGIAGLGEDGPNLGPQEKGAGVFAYGKPRGIRDITDGTSNTVMFAEADGNLGPWTSAKGAIRPLTQQPYIHGPDGIGGHHAGGVNMALCDGSVRFVSENIDPKVMEALTTIAGGENIGGF